MRYLKKFKKTKNHDPSHVLDGLARPPKQGIVSGTGGTLLLGNKRIPKKVIIIFALIFAIFGAYMVFRSFAAGTGITYYVDCNGDNAKDGKSQSTAWKDLSKANAAPLVAGDSILLKRDCAWSPTLTWNGSLNVKSSGVIISNYGTGEEPRITTSGVSGILVKISGSDNTVDGLKLEGPNTSGATNSLYGMQLDAGTRNNIVRNSYITGMHTGIKIPANSSFHKIGPNNQIVNNKMLQAGPGTNDDNGAFGIALLGNDNEIFQNYFEGQSSPSADYPPTDGSAVELYTQCGAAPASNNKIYRNTSVNDTAFSEQGRDTGSTCNTVPTNNVYAYNKYISNLTDAIFLNMRGGEGSGGFGGFTYSKAYNNVAYVTNSTKAPVICSSNCDATHFIYRNNIVVGTRDIAIGASAASNNILFIPGSTDSRYNMDPKFVNLTGNDFHLSAGSPAIDKGSPESLNAGYNKDFDNAAVPSGAAPDIGVYEYGSASNPTGGTTTPNPVSDTTAPTSAVLSATPGDKQVALAWTEAFDDVGVTHYEVWRDTTYVNNLPATARSYTVTNLTNDTSYGLRVVAYDAAGNYKNSNVESVTPIAATQSAPDTTAPVVSITSPANGVVVSGNVTISAKATDNIEVASMQIYIDGKLYATTAADSLTTSWNTRPNRLKGSHTIVIKAKDLAGNEGTKSVTVTVQ